MRSPACVCLYCTSVYVCGGYVMLKGEGALSALLCVCSGLINDASCLLVCTLPFPPSSPCSPMPQPADGVKWRVIWANTNIHDHYCPSYTFLLRHAVSCDCVASGAANPLSTLSSSCLLQDGLAWQCTPASLPSSCCYLLVLSESWQSAYVQEGCCSVVEGWGGAQSFAICFGAQAHSYVIVSLEETCLQHCVSSDLCHVNRLQIHTCWAY